MIRENENTNMIEFFLENDLTKKEFEVFYYLKKFNDVLDLSSKPKIQKILDDHFISVKLPNFYKMMKKYKEMGLMLDQEVDGVKLVKIKDDF